MNKVENIKMVNETHKKAAVFGSYGWSGEAVGIIENNLRSLGLKVVLEGLRSKFAPANEKGETSIEFGRDFAAQL